MNYLKQKFSIFLVLFFSLESLLVLCKPLSRDEQLKCIAALQILGPDGTCHDPLSQGPCEQGFWLVLDREAEDPLQGYCREKPCEGEDFVLRNGKCKFAFSKSVCRGLGERVFNNVLGSVSECECEDGWYRHTDGKCYQGNTKGWCQEGNVLRKATGIDKSQCKTIQDNPCTFPFRYKGLSYDGCTSQNEINEEKTWCSTKTDKFGNHVNGTDNWGYCNKNCYLSGYPQDDGGVQFTEDELVPFLEANYRDKYVCGENPCEPGHLSWEDPQTGEESCFEVLDDLSKCVGILNKDEEIGDYNKIFCRLDFSAFTLVPDMASPCKKGKKWSQHRNKCVRSFGR